MDKDLDATLIQAHFNWLQSTISRMASNSAACKTWAITLASGILVVSRGEFPVVTLVAVLPSTVLAFLDAYYLALERGFRNSFNEFVNQIHVGNVKRTAIFAPDPPRVGVCETLRAAQSFAIWPFYGIILIATILMAWL